MKLLNPGPLTDLSGLCIHTITTKPFGIEEAISKFSASGVSGISVWRDSYGRFSPRQVGEMIRRSGMKTVSLVRGGFFPSVDEDKRKASIKDNIDALREASEMEAPLVVLVCGADPGQSIQTSIDQIRAGLESILPVAEKYNVKLAIEPLHPVYADTRSAISTMKQANDIAEEFGSPWLGIAVDVYHLWWDQDLEREIIRCGEGNRIFAFHVCDWKVPTTDILLDRGLMGEGCINIPQIRQWVNRSGFNGFNEVEIFSNIYWQTDQDEFLKRIIEAYKMHT
ncbi:MAG: sugar phosphate isomerase/epimerase family protein [Bacteroidales bacterium]